MTSALRHFLATGDVLEVLRGVPENTFHGMFSDPPYGISFMGKDWDEVVPGKHVWAECLRVLRPGAYCLVFGGTRTFHRLAVAMEDAGFEIRDVLSWMYGTGFPKSTNVSLNIDAHLGVESKITGSRVLTGNAGVSTKDKGGTYGVQVGSAGNVTVATKGAASPEGQQWSGYGTALKPAWEPVILARKPLEGTIAANVIKWGCGALAIDACRIGEAAYSDEEWKQKSLARTSGNAYGTHKPSEGPAPTGRFPANVILDEEAGAHLDEVVGERPSTLTGRADPRKPHANPSDAVGERVVYGGKGGGANVYADSGGPSRFFYSSKVSTKERNAGLEAFPVLSGGEATDREEGSDGLDSPRAGAGRGGGSHNGHPTLKPIALTEYLARLLLPPTPDATILVPFAGTGSEMIGALKAGWSRVVGIEQDPTYVSIGNARIEHWTKEGTK